MYGVADAIPALSCAENQDRYLDDLIGQFVRFIVSDERNGALELGNPEYTIGELGEVIVELTGSASKLKSKPLLPDDSW
jgi:UDP-glucuronate decarboxylase